MKEGLASTDSWTSDLVARLRACRERGKLTTRSAGNFWARACIPTIAERMALLAAAGVPEAEAAILAGRFS